MLILLFSFYLPILLSILISLLSLSVISFPLHTLITASARRILTTFYYCMYLFYFTYLLFLSRYTSLLIILVSLSTLFFTGHAAIFNDTFFFISLSFTSAILTVSETLILFFIPPLSYFVFTHRCWQLFVLSIANLNLISPS